MLLVNARDAGYLLECGDDDMLNGVSAVKKSVSPIGLGQKGVGGLDEPGYEEEIKFKNLGSTPGSTLGVQGAHTERTEVKKQGGGGREWRRDQRARYDLKCPD